jgi:uncharacterized protein (DUF2267 family)
LLVLVGSTTNRDASDRFGTDDRELLSSVESRADLDSRKGTIAAAEATLRVLGERIAGGQADPSRLDETLTGESEAAEEFSVEEFVERVFEREREQTGSSVADTDEAEQHIRGVTSVLGNAVSGSELDDARNQLPSEFEALFEPLNMSEGQL